MSFCRDLKSFHSPAERLFIIAVSVRPSVRLPSVSLPFRTKNENHLKNFYEILYESFRTIIILLFPGPKLSLIAESFGLLNDLLLPFLSILDASCPIFYLHLANVLFDVILPSVLGTSL